LPSISRKELDNGVVKHYHICRLFGFLAELLKMNCTDKGVQSALNCFGRPFYVMGAQSI